MLLATFPLSGTGVTESLALDQAPFTRMTPFGTPAPGWMVLEKSPPFLGTFCGLALWHQASADIDIVGELRNVRIPSTCQSSNRRSFAGCGRFHCGSPA